MQFLTNGGAISDLYRSLDWSGTPLGPPEGWSIPLKTLVGLALAADQPMFIGWGRDKILLYNDRYAGLLADRHPDALGRPFFHAWPEVYAETAPLFEQVFAGQPVHIENLAVTLDRPGRPAESYFSFSYTPVRDESDAVVGVFCACTETTDQILSARLRQETERSERNRLWDLAEDMLARAGFDGKISAVNPAWTRVLGWSEHHLLSTPYAEFMHPDDINLTLAAIAEMSRTKQSIRYENRIATTAGGWTPIGWTLSPEPDDMNFIAIGRDLTDVKQSERAKNEFVATVSHELRTPLTSIAGSLGLLSMGASEALPDHVARLVTIAHGNCLRLVRLINDMLDIEKMESGQFQLQNVQIALEDFVLVSIEANVGYARTRGVSVSLADMPVSAKVCCDPDRLSQVITNLLSNAVKFSPIGAVVEIAVRREGENWRISVSDRGPGVPADFRSQIFMKFAQADSTNSRSNGGTGLGLSIVRELVLRMGGTVDYVDREGGGTVFFVDLPAIHADAI